MDNKNYSKISEAIKRITQLKKGNYVVFFPSFQFLEVFLRPTSSFPLSFLLWEYLSWHPFNFSEEYRETHKVRGWWLFHLDLQWQHIFHLRSDFHFHYSWFWCKLEEHLKLYERKRFNFVYSSNPKHQAIHLFWWGRRLQL